MKRLSDRVGSSRRAVDQSLPHRRGDAQAAVTCVPGQLLVQLFPDAVDLDQSRTAAAAVFGAGLGTALDHSVV